MNNDINFYQLFNSTELHAKVKENIKKLNNYISNEKTIKVSNLLLGNKTFNITNFLENNCGFQGDEFSGLYVFLLQNEKEPEILYTGISRNLKVRIKDHISGNDPSVASFAVLIARNMNMELNNYFTTNAYKQAKTVEEINEKSKRKKELKEMVENIQKNEMPNFYIAAIPITNYQELHATEAFVAGEFQCKYNSFKTH
jgi:predicted GIY-YIG superfamily endonuclease